MSDSHHSSLLRPPEKPVAEESEVFNPYWNIEVCPQCGGNGSVPSGVTFMDISEMIGCDICDAIGYTNERIREILDEYYHLEYPESERQ